MTFLQADRDGAAELQLKGLADLCRDGGEPLFAGGVPGADQRHRVLHQPGGPRQAGVHEPRRHDSAARAVSSETRAVSSRISNKQQGRLLPLILR